MLTINVSKQNEYHVYGLFKENELVWCDYGRWTDVTTLRNVRRNTLFVENEDYQLIIFGVYGNVLAARNEVARTMQHYLGDKVPLLNGNAMYRAQKKIKCVETGEVFKNASALIKEKGLNAGAVYPHLNGVVGHKTIKGLTYIYVDEAKQPAPAPKRVMEINYDWLLENNVDFAKGSNMNRPELVKLNDIVYDVDYAKKVAVRTIDTTVSSVDIAIMRLLLTRDEFDEVTMNVINLRR